MPTYYVNENLHFYHCPCGWSVQCVDRRRMKLASKLHDKYCPEKDTKVALDYSTKDKIPPNHQLAGVGIKEIHAKDKQNLLK